MYFFCKNERCSTVFHVVGEDAEVEFLLGEKSTFWPDQYLCPTCSGLALVRRRNSVSSEDLADKSLRIIEAQEMFQAQYGLGLPEEQDCRREIIEEILRTKRLRRVGGHAVPGTTSFCLEFLETEDGTRLYFGASTHGAVLYRIVRPTSYTSKVMKEVSND